MATSMIEPALEIRASEQDLSLTDLDTNVRLVLIDAT